MSVSPIIPFLNEPELERILEAAAAAGASSRVQRRAAPALGSEPAVPALAGPALSRACRTRHGAGARDARRADNDARFGSRMTGQGVWAQLLRQRLDKACARLGLNRERIELDLDAVQAAGAGARRHPAKPRCSRRRLRPGGSARGCARLLEQVLDPVGPALGVGRMPVAAFLEATRPAPSAACAGAR